MPTFNRRSFLAATSAFGLVGAIDLRLPARAADAARLTTRVDKDYTIFDPAFRVSPGDGNVARSVFHRLMAQKPNSAELELDAAAELTQVSPTLIEFTLKPGLMFTDGYGEMTAEDVKFSFERFSIAAPEGQESTYKGDWAGLEEVEVTGKYTGKIKLSKPNAGLMAIAIADVSGCIVSKKAVTELGVAHNTKPVGSGPYQLVSVEKQRGVVLKRNPDYAGTAPHFDEIEGLFIPDSKTAELALRSGELDFAVLPPTVATPLKDVEGLAVEENPGLAYIWLGINMEKPPFNDLRVRQAVRLALDVDQMLLAGYDGKAPRLNALILPPITGFWADAPAYQRNVEEAKRLLAEAGQTAITTRITVLNQPAFTNMALVAQALLAEVGITVEVDAQEGGTYWTAGAGDAGKDIDLFIMRFNGKLDPNFLMQWFVTSQIGIWNWQRFASPEFDALADQALAEIDPAKRAELVIAAQKLMDESAAFVWLTNDVAMTVHDKTVAPAFLPGAIDWQFDRFTAA
ncbi:ABC transporter substrate-binding protein [Aureimonas glaciei]|uniref:ABC transporter substrate-binding protein n=1 Tax=Aureimonas glaciei TaxID=1776957 RepID=A0A916YGU1_9HYPH|nr:ABC transporter substrate-binding protein [Aureimonas glaciei]GGD44001.1 ABC transporter substrate-binding protein [Aureimonas glaciei]